MPNPGTFTGSRGDFLREQRERYAQAVKDGNINDVVTDIQRQYLKRYPITLPHDEEPSPEWLSQVNDDAPDPEIRPPDVDGMGPEDASKALQDHADLMKKLKDRKDSIRRRLHYMYSKEKDARPSAKSGMATDIVSALSAKILGVDAKLPRQKTAYNVWGPQHRELVDPVFIKRVEDENIPANQQLALRSAVYKELFDQLPEDERELWAKAAIREHEKAVREIKKNLEKGASTTPQDRQRVIAALPAILEPIFDLLAEHTGWRFSGIAGGPEPADGGRLNMIMIHSGVIPGTVKVDFGSDQHTAFKKYITSSFGSYLKKCYSIDECRSRALPEGFDIRSLADVESEEALDLHSFAIDKEHVEASGSKSHKAKRLFEKEGKSRKSAKPEPPKTGTPSPPMRFGPPIGKKKLRELPSKDKPSGLARPQQSSKSPLASGSITASAIDGSAILPPIPVEPDEAIFSQGFNVEHSAEMPEKRAFSAEESSALNEAVGAALHGYVSTASRTDPSTPAPSRDPLAIQPLEVEKLFTPPPPSPSVERHTGGLPVPGPNVPPPSPPGSRPVTPPLNATLQGAEAVASPSRPAPVPLRETPYLHSATPPSRHATPPPCPTTPLIRLTPPPSRPITARPSQEAPASGDTSQPALQLPTPSGAVTVPEFPPANSNAANNKTRSARAASGSVEKRKAPTQKGGTPKKKQRTTTSNAAGAPFNPAFLLDLPSNCPKWLRNALDLLTREDLGSTWRDVVSTWLRFEENSGVAEHADRLGSQDRPQVMADWIKSARPAHRTPELGNLGRFEAGFVSWWNSVQPGWRNAGIDSEVGGGRSGDDWSDLEGCHGLNGLLTVVAALFFWGSTASTEEEVKRWGTAAADVLYVLQQLA